jgi:energy-converting hydrogenase A subunit I
MTPEKKSGLISLILSLIGFGILFITNNKVITYMIFSIFAPMFIYGIGTFLIPPTRRKKEGQIPFRGW